MNINLYYQWLPYSYKVAWKYSQTWPKENRQEFVDAAPYALILAINKFEKKNKGSIQGYIYNNVLQVCAVVAASLLNCCVESAKRNYRLYGCHSIKLMPCAPESFLNNKSLSYEDVYLEVARKDVIELIQLYFDEMEIDSVMYPYNEFRERYPHVRRKSHDNLRTRTIDTMRKVYHGFKRRRHISADIERTKPILEYVVTNNCKRQNHYNLQSKESRLKMKKTRAIRFEWRRNARQQGNI